MQATVGWQLDRDLDLAPPVHIQTWVFGPGLVVLRPRRQGGFDALEPARLCQILDGLVLIRAADALGHVFPHVVAHPAQLRRELPGS